MQDHARSVFQFLTKCTVPSIAAQRLSSGILRKMSRRVKLSLQERMILGAYIASNDAKGKAFMRDANKLGYTEIEWTYSSLDIAKSKQWTIEEGSAWNIEQGSAWTIEQGSAWNIEQGSAWKIEQGSAWKIEWTNGLAGKKVPTDRSVALIAKGLLQPA